ncbi:UvrD-helicase domain-containing protein [Echinicola vietnamensis]|uniref:DNA 3'-5' helicase n=1 Tax=Echinicola vietnamensis (strain DSM 17526 / LMG 23754 / KMM 6221) TaxID=926556 RepID=L0G4L3_ECHVK|nr:UvrD-helicase domain-containing protein [Echinicola vietnamensis]AGA80258.1 ATP-dependent exonuclase V beta subunit, helicase and exonuclease domain-containing [Echinicola vietnamensis DSM 17526]
MEAKPFIIYKSSAGSGKTYTLTLEYLKLALAQPMAFRGILAVTFTNKATQEMKGRILEVLGRLKNEVRPQEFLDQQLMQHLQLDEEGLKSRASVVLSAILHDYANFSVSTIDSFFQKVVRAFAREIDLQAKFDVALDQAAVLERVVDRVVQHVMDDPYLHKWLVDYALTKIQEGRSWDIRSNIRDLGMEIFTENFKQYQQLIREFLSSEQNLDIFRNYLNTKKQALYKKASEMKMEANSIRQQFGLEWTDFPYGRRSFAMLFDKLGEHTNPIPELTESRKVAIDNESKWYSKTSKQKDAIISAYHAGLGDIYREFVPLRKEWLTYQAIDMNFYAYGIFRNLLEELRDLKDEENILMISDANDFLKEITKENDAPFIYEKVGNQYKHFLIDEFQDTSGFQWDSFKPLLENSLGYEHTNLVVGDVKQSIYRWRGGDMKLLLEKVEEDIGPSSIQVKGLDTNYRSLPNVVAFNNALFSALPAQLESTFERETGHQRPGILTKAYQDVAQKVPSAKNEGDFKGLVRMEFLETSNEEEEPGYEEAVLAKIPEMVMTLQDQGYRPKDIAFLVRKKHQGAMITDALMAYKHEHPELEYSFDVVSDESMFLSKAATVKALIAALNYLADPADPVPFQTMWFYWSSLNGKPISHEVFSSLEKPAWLAEKIAAFEKEEQRIARLPLMELLEELVDILGFNDLRTELAYISGFKEAVYDYVANNRADLSGFLNWWEENSEKRTVKIPEGHDAMPIMTIHKSKGLQYKVVLMPFLTWRIVDYSKDNIIWSPFRDTAEDVEAVIPLTLKKELADSIFQPVHLEEVTMAYLDTLNMIYVALTRAEEVLWTLSPKKVVKQTTKISLNSLEKNLLELVEQGKLKTDSHDFSECFDQDLNVFEWGAWPEGSRASPAIRPAEDQWLTWNHRHWGELLEVKKYAVDFSEEGLAQRHKRSFGLLIHELLEKSDSHQAAMDQLQAFYFEGRLDQEERSLVSEQLDKLFINEQFRSWFEGEGRVLTEQGVILPGGRQKRPDRIVIKDNVAEVVDFKTGEELDKYQRQVREYMQLVAGLGHFQVRGFLCYLETGKIVEVSATNGGQYGLFD